jgi:magnesium transporter
VGIRQVVWREVVTGLLVGAALALVFFPLGLLFWGQADVALAVSLSLFAASSAATTVAMALPFLIHRLGGDPAYGSGPLATVIQDILSIVVYLGISVTIVN